MILKETLKGIVKAQKEELSKIDYGTQREELSNIKLNMPFALVVSGIRRCGKSTLLRQVMKTTKNFYYFNFEDPRVANFEVEDFQKLNDIFSEEYGQSNNYFFDEIQNIHKWELFVRTMLDKNKHFMITGSNASLLSKELGTRLTGRHLNHELFPFSYREFLLFTSKKAGTDSFGEYLENGGFPEYLLYKKSSILQELFNDIIMRDIIVRYKLRSTKEIKDIALYLITNAGAEFSYNNLAKTFNLGSTNSAVAFVSYLEDSYLLFTISKFDYSLKKQAVNPKKVYSIDNGLSSAISISFSSNKVRMLENHVFLDLRRTGKEIYYFKGEKECDFLIKEKNKITAAIQVCYELNEDNKEREVEGLIEALQKFDLSKGLILTYDQDDVLKLSGKTITIKPVWKWVLGD
ncbi:ATP-binding protein [Candidatus Micrarchaeota archaeon]|nr:ATP-binding protein [Candidatus Micrarchaeota archaeon]MBU1166145.1 ATP-binding protein [Candidatus Micrarchaeota archaeon]MBU1887311.1 ATP-binding protein [Candidatus Micrarchaeota archaeon]